MKLTIRKIGKVQIIELNGKLVLGTAQHLAEAFKNLVTDEQKCILIDLRKVPYMDSSGIGEVAACRKRAKDKQVEVKLLKPENKFDLSVEFLLGLMYGGAIFGDERDALGSF